MVNEKIVLVTGSTSGIGKIIAEAFEKNNYVVAYHGLENGPKSSYGHDISNLDGCNKLVESVTQDLGPIDILINNAGIQHVAPIEDFPTDMWEKIISLNLSASFYLTRAVWPNMKAKQFGRIINISSVHGLRASEFKSAYVSAKHGQIGLTKTLALEGAPHGITVNAICPGYVKTPLVENQIKNQAISHNISELDVIEKIMLKKQPIKKFIDPSIIAEMALLLAGNHSQAVTGSSFVFDGGWTAQ